MCDFTSGEPYFNYFLLGYAGYYLLRGVCLVIAFMYWVCLHSITWFSDYLASFKAPEPGSKHQNLGLRLVSEQDVEAVIEKVVAAGAVAEGGVTEDRVLPGKHSGKVRDPFGIVWTIVGNITETIAAETESNNTAAEPDARILL